MLGRRATPFCSHSVSALQKYPGEKVSHSDGSWAIPKLGVRGIAHVGSSKLFVLVILTSLDGGSYIPIGSPVHNLRLKIRRMMKNQSESFVSRFMCVVRISNSPYADGRISTGYLIKSPLSLK